MATLSEARRAVADATTREVRARAFDAEVRDTADGGLAFAGYASVTSSPYEVNDWLGSYTETVGRGAFAKSLAERDDVRLLFNHDGVPLARTKSGTMTLREIVDPAEDPQERGQTGLWVEAELDGSSPLVQTIRSAMKRGDLAEMSFAFQATRSEWNEDYTERTIREVRMFDTSIVTYPANPATSAQLNSADLAGLVTRAASALDAEDAETIRRAVTAFDTIARESTDPADYLFDQGRAERDALGDALDGCVEQLAAESDTADAAREARGRQLALDRARSTRTR